jgi:antitoxin CcdA
MTRHAKISPDAKPDDALIEEAQTLKIETAGLDAAGLKDAVRKEKERLFLIENAEAIRYSNEYVEKHGLPLAKYRLF